MTLAGGADPPDLGADAQRRAGELAMQLVEARLHAAALARELDARSAAAAERAEHLLAALAREELANQRLRQAQQHAEARLALLEASRSWRLTAPLRRLGRLGHLLWHVLPRRPPLGDTPPEVPPLAPLPAPASDPTLAPDPIPAPGATAARVVRPPERPRLAFVSPLPPQPSGIADYSAELLPSLARHYDITLVSEAPPDPVLADFPRLDPADFLRQAGQFDRVLYQIGNSAMHRFQTEALLPRCPGVVVLHDAFLSDSINSLVHERQRPGDFAAVLLRSHGYPALRHDATQGRAASLRRYPCCLDVLRDAVGVIQHSRHGVAVLERHFGAAATRGIAVVPLLRAERARPDRATARAALGLAEDAFVVCSLGGVTPAKAPAMLAEAWRRAAIPGHLVFVGDAAPELVRVLGDAAAGIGFTGRLARERYDAWIAAADVAVQWRTDSRGESSAAVADALLAGLPLIVNRHGSAAELPEAVVLGLPDRADIPALAAAIVALHDDAARRAALAVAARAYALRELAPEAAARRYHAAIERAYATGAGSLWRTGGQPRLLIDMSVLARDQEEDPDGAGDAVRQLARRVLETPPPAYRGEAVRVHAGRLWLTYAAPLRLLGHLPLDLAETPLEAAVGDVLLCVDVNPALTAAALDELRRLRREGLRIALVVQAPPPRPDPAGEEWYGRMLTLADCAVCTSRAGVAELLAWLDADRDRRTTPLPIGCFRLGPQGGSEDAAEPCAAASWDDSFRQLCAAALDARWCAIWRP